MNRKFLLSAVLALAVALGYLIVNPNAGGKIGTKTYSSSALNFEITYPRNLKVEEKFTSVIVSSESEYTYIHISRSGTNFEDVNSYLSELDLKNKSEIIETEQIEVNGLPFVRRLLKSPGQVGPTLMYCVYINSQVFTLETFTPGIFGDLDQIAKSFKYTGE